MLLGRYKISGHSMLPYLTSGDTIIVSSIPYLFLKPKKGDVVLLKIKNKTLVKRIKNIGGLKYFVAGDNKRDSLRVGPLSRRDIIGKVLLKI